jgi:urea transport system substrate-binding protein
MIVGTPHYMAPEQASGLQVDARADLFSLGCVAYTALTGRLAFEGASTMAVLMSLANHTPTPLCVANLHVPAELSDLVGRMMAKNRDLRPASADEVVAALDGMRPEAPPPPSAGPARAEGGFFGRARPSDAVKTGPHPSRASQATPAPWPAQTPRPGPISAPFTLTAATMPSKMAIPLTPPAPPKKPAGGWVKYAAGAVVLAALAGGAAVFLGGGKPTAATGPDKAAVSAPTAGGRPAVPFPGTGTVKVGLLYATAGEAADDDRPVAAATELAVKEAGTVLGRPLEAVVPDGLSDPDGFAKAAERLIADDRVAALFGGGPPAARAAVARVAARNKVPLFSPGRADGTEPSDWVVTLGPVPNQSVLPAVDYLVHRRGKRNVFHVGSEDSYSRGAYKYIDAYMSKQRLPAGSPRLVGTAYLAADGHNADEIADAVRKAKPDAIVNTISGPSKAKGALLDKLTAGSNVPVLSFGLTESERRSLAATGRPAELLVAGVGFPPLAGGPLAPVSARFDALRTASDPMAAAYSAVKLWKKAVELARADDRGMMMDKLGLVSEPAVAGPGYVKVDAATRCAFLPLRVGVVEPGGGVRVVYEVNRDDGIRPIPDLYTKDDKDWNGFLNGLTRSK